MSTDLDLAENAELVIGLVGAVGTDLQRITDLLAQELKTFRYNTTVPDTGENAIRLSGLLHQLPKYQSLKKIKDEYDYISEHMTAGDDFRKSTERNDALAVLAISRIIRIREIVEKHGKLRDKIIPRQAYILRSLKNPAELNTLREIYGNAFYLIAAYSPRKVRRQYLASRIASRRRVPASALYDKAESLIQRDEEELGMPHGQNVRGFFHRADVFIEANDDISALRQSLARFVRLIFGDTFHTPTRAEYSMFHAHAASLRSAELGRQVGAAIATRDGDIVAVGCNEVPKAGGGMYWCDDKPDKREFQEGYDANDAQKRVLIAETISILKTAGWLAPIQNAMDVDSLVNLALHPESPVLPKDSKIRNVIEFGRAVHGEMAALTDAARRGVPVQGCTLYVTTFLAICVRGTSSR